MDIDTSLLQRAAAAAAAHQQYRAGSLFVVATPIGNLADLSLRALYVLGRVDAIACEDTRVTAGLLQRLGLQRPLVALHAHNEREAAQRVLQRLARGESVAYVSDAGTPAVSDPGAALVAAVHAQGHPVVPIPGPSSALAALSAAGDATGGGFRVCGFLPPRGAERQRALQALVADASTLVLFEAPHRIEALLGELARQVPVRRLTVCRELTKQFETITCLTAAEAPAWLAAQGTRARGEFVVVLHARPPAEPGAEEGLSTAARRTLTLLLAELPLKRAVALAAEITGVPRNALYAQALALRAGADDPEGAMPPPDS